MAGEVDDTFDGCLDIILTGNHSTTEYEALYDSERSGVKLGAKAIGVY